MCVCVFVRVCVHLLPLCHGSAPFPPLYLKHDFFPPHFCVLETRVTQKPRLFRECVNRSVTPSAYDHSVGGINADAAGVVVVGVVVGGDGSAAVVV